MLESMLQQFVTVAGMGIVLGGGLCGIVIILDYVLTSAFSMMKVCK